MLFAVKDANHARGRPRADGLGISGLQVAGEVREKGAGQLCTDAMPGEKGITRQQAVEIHADDLPVLEIFRLRRMVAVAGAENVEARAHQVKGSTVGCHIEKPYPKI